MNPRSRCAASGLALALLLTLTPACETDDSVGGLQPICLTFEPIKEPVDDEVVSVWGLDSTCDTTEVELYYSGALAVWSASFTVEYPAGISQFVQVETADGFLFEDGVAPIVNAGEIVPGRVVIGLSRTDSATNAGIVPTTNTLLARLVFFRAANGGEGAVELTEANLSIVATPGDIPTQAVPAVPFVGGEFFIEN